MWRSTATPWHGLQLPVQHPTTVKADVTEQRPFVVVNLRSTMPDFKEIAKGGWHSKSKDGKSKESWRGDFKGINVSLLLLRAIFPTSHVLRVIYSLDMFWEYTAHKLCLNSKFYPMRQY
jgi:hypothetical protein